MSFAKYAAPLLDETLKENLVEKVKQEMLRLFKPVEIILFGSAAEGTMTARSDLDFVVVVEAVEQIRTVNKLYAQISSIVKWPLDILVVDKSSFTKKSQVGGVFFIARRQGVSVYNCVGGQ